MEDKVLYSSKSLVERDPKDIAAAIISNPDDYAKETLILAKAYVGLTFKEDQ